MGAEGISWWFRVWGVGERIRGWGDKDQVVIVLVV